MSWSLIGVKGFRLKPLKESWETLKEGFPAQ